MSADASTSVCPLAARGFANSMKVGMTGVRSSAQLDVGLDICEDCDADDDEHAEPADTERPLA